MRILASIFNDLDATSYFFVSSGIFTVFIAALFLAFGLLIGFFTWGRYKRRMLESNRTVEAMKDETALLKRRLAEVAVRPAAKPATQTQAEIPTTSPLAALVQAAKRMETAPQPSSPAGVSFTVWTEPEWEPQPATAAVAPSAAFSAWTEVGFQPPASAHPASHAFSVWTDDEWEAPPVKYLPLHPSAAFSVWTESPLASSAPEKAPHAAPGDVVAVAASLVKTVAAPSKPADVAAAPSKSELHAKQAPFIHEAGGKGSILARAVAAAKPLPPARTTMTFADWLEAREAQKETPAPVSQAEVFRDELSNGAVRNDPSLGIVFVHAPKEPDDLTRINGLDRATQSVLRSLGVHTFKQIATWNGEQADEFTRRLGLDGAGVGEKWIQQARELASQATA